jgi:hypothetical protein
VPLSQEISHTITSASTHDSQTAIPPAAMTARRVRACYEPTDAGCHSEHIQAYGERPGHVAPIPDVERQNKRLRTIVERMTGRLKDEFGGGHIRVRGRRKATAHLMLGVLTLAVDRVPRLAR